MAVEVRGDFMKDDYFVAFEFMFRFVETFMDSSFDDDNIVIIYKKFYEIREVLQNGK